MDASADGTKKARRTRKGASVADTGTGKETVSVSISVSLAWTHIQSAAVLARECAQIERQVQGKVPIRAGSDPTLDEEWFRDKAHVIGAVFAAVAYLEATINELFDATANGASYVVNFMDPVAAAAMAALWHLDPVRKRTSALDKYTVALRLAGKPPFDQGRLPYQDAKDLILLRDNLTHYKPMWNGPSETPETAKLRQVLEQKFRSHPNPFVDPGSHFLDLYLGHACAKWAVESSIAFVDEFYRQMGPRPPHDPIRGSLTTG
jgi:hypothetical protein